MCIIKQINDLRELTHNSRPQLSVWVIWPTTQDGQGVDFLYKHNKSLLLMIHCTLLLTMIPSTTCEDISTQWRCLKGLLIVLLLVVYGWWWWCWSRLLKLGNNESGCKPRTIVICSFSLFVSSSTQETQKDRRSGRQAKKPVYIILH